MFPFKLNQHHDKIALIDSTDQKEYSYSDLLRKAEQWKREFPARRSLVFLFIQPTVSMVEAYLALLSSDHVVCLLNANMNLDLIIALIQQYRPEVILTLDQQWQGCLPEYKSRLIENIHLFDLVNEHLKDMHPKLKLMMSTSGTTGSPKWIRLSLENLESNAQSISSYLKLSERERAITSLPLHYSYGLSILHSHLNSGGSIVLTESSIVQEPFWKDFNKYRCTSLAGVPYHYEIFDKLKFETFDLPSLQYMTQAGGRLSSELVMKFDQLMKKKGGLFYVMYGQTEATSRISYLPPKYLPEKADSIGIAIPGGTLRIYQDDHDVTDLHDSGEIVYFGKNVMLGYAESIEDLRLGDQLNGTLKTGDLGYCDEDGIFHITGRIKRISKIYGLRINLDEIEKHLRHFGTIAVISDDRIIQVLIENGTDKMCQDCLNELVREYKLHESSFICKHVEKIPRTSSGKIDYKQLHVESTI